MLVQDPSQHMDEQEFKNRADQTLDDLYKRLLAASERHDFEADLGGGALVIEFEAPPAKFVVSPNAPVQQIWLSARMRSYKLGWSDDAGTFVLDGEALDTLVERLTREQLAP